MRQLLKPMITACTLVICLTGTNAFSADSGQKRLNPHGGEVIKFTDLKNEVRTSTSDRDYKTVKPKSIKDKKRYSKEIVLIKKYRKLNRKVLRKNAASKTQVMSYVSEYEQLAKQMDSFVAAGGYEEGIGFLYKRMPKRASWRRWGRWCSTVFL